MKFPDTDPCPENAIAAASSPHVLVLPFPAQGHISPFLSAAEYLAANGILVTIVHVPDGFVPQGPQPADKLGDGRTSLIRYETMPSGVDHSQPLTRKVVRGSIEFMRSSFTELLQRLAREGNAPVCLLFDSFFGWSAEVAQQFGLPNVVLWTGSASVYSLGRCLPELVERGFIPATGEGALDKTVDFVPGLSPMRVRDMPEVFLASDGLDGDSYLLMASVFDNLRRADLILMNTIYELESPALDALQGKRRIPIHAVGPLHMMNAAHTPPAGLTEEESSCLQWLDRQEQSSVLYIAFGSVASLEDHAFAELAHGLEASGERFLWVIRRDTYKDKASVREVLPEGFMERTSDRGRILSWAPQLAVLGHASVGAFLTHCGWNSVLESLSYGVPMLGFPQRAEQMTNLKFVVHDWNVGLPLLTDGKAERKCMEDAIAAIMKNQQVRKRACEWKEIVIQATQGSSKDSFLKFVDGLKHGNVARHEH